LLWLSQQTGIPLSNCGIKIDDDGEELDEPIKDEYSGSVAFGCCSNDPSETIAFKAYDGVPNGNEYLIYEVGQLCCPAGQNVYLINYQWCPALDEEFGCRASDPGIVPEQCEP